MTSFPIPTMNNEIPVPWNFMTSSGHPTKNMTSFVIQNRQVPSDVISIAQMTPAVILFSNLNFRAGEFSDIMLTRISDAVTYSLGLWL